MRQHLHKLKTRAQLFRIHKEWVFAAVLVAVAILATLLNSRQPFASSEVQFTDSSASGLAIVPASCPSSPHYAGECDPSPVCNVPAVAALFGVNCPEPAICANGASNYPTCTFPPSTCANGASNYPTCTFPPSTCANGASNYPTCTFPPSTCANGASNYPTCTFPPSTCANGASNYPTCTFPPSTSANGASNYPTCTFPPSTCANGASNYPTCTFAPTCTLLRYCVGTSLWLRNSVCSTSLIEACSNDCGCVLSPSVIVWQVRPTLVQSGERVNVNWDTKNVKSCTVSSTNPPGAIWSGRAGSQQCGSIKGSTIYTLRCTGLDNSPVTRSTTVNIIPIFQEQ